MERKILSALNKHKKIDFDKLIDSDINKPARYMGHEIGVKTKDWTKAKVRWALTYPEIYEIGASNLGHIILYSILNEVPHQICDRAYLPADDLSQKLREKSEPLFGVETRMPLIAFDILGFSLSYELGATNILEMLDLANIPIYSKHRGNLPIDHISSPPLIFAGGPTATSNPEPYANFFDFFALGDGEELLPEIGLCISELKKNNLSRSALLKELSEIPGVYVPSLYEIGKDNISLEPIKAEVPKKILRRVAKPIPSYGMGLVPNIETVHDRLTIEIRRGCTKGCRFCQPGMITRPARDLEPMEVIEAVEKGMEKTGFSDFSLLSLSCSDYLSLPSVGIELRNRLAEKNISLQLPSQRIDQFDENIAHILGGNRKSGLTFAPEAGSQRLRDIINKGLTDDDLLNGITKAMENGYKKIKLYFMIGLPGENDEDVIGIANTCRWIQKQCIHLGKLSLNITISNFTPKPHTPFQWHSVSSKDFVRKQNLLKEAFQRSKGIKVNYTDVRISAIEDFIGRGNRELSSVIENAWKSGAGMDAWFESQERAYAAWMKAIKNANLQEKYRELEIGNWSSISNLKGKEIYNFCIQPLPWDHIDTGLNKEWLIQDFQRALNQKVIPDCSFNSCSKCGVCGPELGENKIIPSPPIPKQRIEQKPHTEKNCKVRMRFSKRNPMHLTSHLDLTRIIERALRRSNLPVSYSGGFHPLPRLQIGLALPLGIEGLSELMDIDFYQPLEAETVMKDLQEELPIGLEILSAIKIPINSKSLSQELSEAIWSFELQAISDKKPLLTDWEEGLKHLLYSQELVWSDKDKKGRDRQRDCRPALKSLIIKDIGNIENELEPVEIIKVKLDALIDSMGRSVKPIQIQHWLSKFLNQPLNIKCIKRDELKLH